jgi:hypothetical protein
VKTAQVAHDLVARAQVEVIRVGEDHLRAHRAKLQRVQRLDRAERPDGHERRRLDDAVRRRESPGSCPAVACVDLEGEGQG